MPLYSFEGLTPSVHPTRVHRADRDARRRRDRRGGRVGLVRRGAARRLRAGRRAERAPTSRTARCSTAHPASRPRSARARRSRHNCVVHGAFLGEECLIANGAIVLDGAQVGDTGARRRGLGRRGRTRTSRPGMLAAGAPAVVKRVVAGSPAEFWVVANPPAYAELAQRHRAGIEWVGD